MEGLSGIERKREICHKIAENYRQKFQKQMELRVEAQKASSNFHYPIGYLFFNLADQYLLPRVRKLEKKANHYERLESSRILYVTPSFFLQRALKKSIPAKA